jgi:hypothetical protein
LNWGPFYESVSALFVSILAWFSLRASSSSSWELASCKLNWDEFIYFKFGTCKYSSWTRFKNRP